MCVRTCALVSLCVCFVLGKMTPRFNPTSSFHQAYDALSDVIVSPQAYDALLSHVITRTCCFDVRRFPTHATLAYLLGEITDTTRDTRRDSPTRRFPSQWRDSCHKVKLCCPDDVLTDANRCSCISRPRPTTRLLEFTGSRWRSWRRVALRRWCCSRR